MMADIGKVHIDIEYCVPCGYGNLASWAVSEMFAAGGTDAAIQLTPGKGGVFKITVVRRHTGDLRHERPEGEAQEPPGIACSRGRVTATAMITLRVSERRGVRCCPLLVGLLQISNLGGRPSIH